MMREPKRKPKILYVITKSNWGGAQRYVYDLSCAMTQRGFDVVVALGGTGGFDAQPGRLQEMLTSSKIRTEVIKNFTRDIFIFKEYVALNELLRLFKTERPDIVHLNSSKAGLLGAIAARMCGVPAIVFTVHGWPFGEHHRPLVWQGMAWLGSWITLLLSHQVVSVSEFDRNQGFALPFSYGKILTIYNGQKSTDTLERTEARALLAPDLGPQELLLGTVGELNANKGIDLALQALAEVTKHIKNVTYLVIGAGEEYDPLQKQIRKLGLTRHVRLLGFIPDVEKLLSAFDLLLLPDRKAGFPYIVLEAGNAGLAVIATTTGGVPEIISDTVNGRLIPPLDRTALSEAIKELLGDHGHRAQLGALLKQSVTAQFGFERMIEETESLYKALLRT